MLQPLSRHPRLDQLCCRRAQNDFAVRGRMVRMGVADENLFRAELRFVRIEPQPQIRQMKVALAVFDPEL